MKKKNLFCFLQLKTRGFTLAEFMIAFIIGAIILLAVSTLSGISVRSYENVRGDSQTYGELMAGFEFMKNQVRKARNKVAVESPSSYGWTSAHSWVGNVLAVDDGGFGMNQTGNQRFLIFLEDKTNPNSTVIFNITNNSAEDLPDFFNLNLAQNSTLISVGLQGRKDKELFNLQTSVSRRN